MRRECGRVIEAAEHHECTLCLAHWKAREVVSQGGGDVFADDLRAGFDEQWSNGIRKERRKPGHALRHLFGALAMLVWLHVRLGCILP